MCSVKAPDYFNLKSIKKQSHSVKTYIWRTITGPDSRNKTQGLGAVPVQTLQLCYTVTVNQACFVQVRVVQGCADPQRVADGQTCFLSEPSRPEPHLFHFISYSVFILLCCFSDLFYWHLFLTLLWAVWEARLWWDGQSTCPCPADFFYYLHALNWQLGQQRHLHSKRSIIITSATLTWHTAKSCHHGDDGKLKCLPHLRCLTGLLWHQPVSTVRLVSGARRPGGRR